jgi:hypothetical protein
MSCDRAVKVYDPGTRRYRSGRLIDRSVGGLLMELTGPVHGGAEQMLSVAIEDGSETGLVRADEMLPVIIVRRVGSRIAVRLHDVAQSLMSRAA